MVELRVSAHYTGSAKTTLHAGPAPIQLRKFDRETALVAAAAAAAASENKSRLVP